MKVIKSVVHPAQIQQLLDTAVVPAKGLKLTGQLIKGTQWSDADGTHRMANVCLVFLLTVFCCRLPICHCLSPIISQVRNQSLQMFTEKNWYAKKVHLWPR